MPTHPDSRAAYLTDTWSITPSVPPTLAEESGSPQPFDDPHFPTFHFLYVSSLFPTHHLCNLSFKGSRKRPGHPDYHELASNLTPFRMLFDTLGSMPYHDTENLAIPFHMACHSFSTADSCVLPHESASPMACQ